MKLLDIFICSLTFSFMLAAYITYDYASVQEKACIQAGINRSYGAVSTLDQLKLYQDNVVAWCRTGKMVR